MIRLLSGLLVIIVAWSLFGADRPAGLMQQPAVSRTHIAFVYDGQVWVVPRGGKTARKVTDSKGRKFDPRFSPDGKRLAFASGEYSNALNLYIVPVSGGTMSRVTYLPSHQILCQWTSDDRLLFYTNSQSFVNWEMELFTVSPRGELPSRLPIAHGADGALDETGEWLAYTPRYPSSLINQWSAIAAAPRPMFNCSISGPASLSRSATGKARTSSRCGTGERCTTSPMKGPRTAGTCGPTT